MKSGLHLDYDITRLRGADYNPRKIDDESLHMLGESIRRLGLVKPLIVRNDLLVAGHQRTKALRSIGVTTAPVYVLSKNTTTYDEVRFNQLHNGTDMDAGDEDVHLPEAPLALGYQQVSTRVMKANFRGRLAPVRQAICQLITSYGPWGGVVATQSGKVIHAAQYALAAHLTGTPLTVYAIPDEREEEYQRFLDRSYGEFSYDGLSRDTYIQTYAQMLRLRAGPSGKGNRSTLYETLVIPWLAQHRGARGIDFGSGQGDYFRFLKDKGYAIQELELFRRKGSNPALDLAAVNRMIDGMLDSLRRHGPFDFVVCDSVLNSVDCKDAERAVMTVLNVLAKPGGQIFFSGRKRERADAQSRYTKAESSNRLVEFLDKDGFTALYRNGSWFYQKFHDAEQTKALCVAHGLRAVKHQRTESTTSWQVHALKERPVPLEQALFAAHFEFNLPVSPTRRLERHEDVARIVRSLYDAA